MSERYGSLVTDDASAITPQASVTGDGYLRGRRGSPTSEQTPVTPLECVKCHTPVVGIVYFAGPLDVAGPLCENCLLDERRSRWITHRLAMLSWGGPDPGPFDDRRPLPPAQPCGVCARRLALDWRHRPSDFLCSRACERERRNAKRRVIHDRRPCIACGESFTPKRTDARYCSSACRQDAYRKRKLGAELA